MTQSLSLSSGPTLCGTLSPHQGPVMIQKEDQDDPVYQQSWPQAEGQGGNGQGPTTPATHTVAPPKCWLLAADIKIEVKYSENLTFLTSDVIKLSVVLRILVSAMFTSCFMHRGYIIHGKETIRIYQTIKGLIDICIQ